MAKTLKEIAIELLEKYEASENVAICEYSTNINKDMDLLDKEVKKYRRMIEDADRKTEPQIMPIKKTMTGTHGERIEYTEAEMVIEDEPQTERSSE